MAYHDNLLFYSTMLLLSNTYCSIQSELFGSYVCTKFELNNKTSNETEVQKNLTNVQMFVLNLFWSTFEKTEQISTDIKIKVEIDQSPIRECCDGFVESSDHTFCIPIKNDILYYFGALVGLLTITTIIILFLKCYFCIDTNNTDVTLGEYSLPLDTINVCQTESFHDEDPFYSTPVDFERPNTLKRTPIAKTYSADKGLSYPIKCHTVHDKGEVSHLVEIDISSSMLSHSNNEVSADERADSFKSDEIFIKNERSKAQNSENIYHELEFD